MVGSLTVDPTYARKMQEKANACGLSSKVFFHGVLDSEPLIERLEFSQVMVMPSSYEGFGIAYLEGMGLACLPLQRHPERLQSLLRMVRTDI